MRLSEVSMEQRRNAREVKTGDPRENSAASCVVRYDSTPEIDLGSPSVTGMKGRGKWEIPEKTRRLTTSSSTIPTCENPVTRQGIEPGSPWWEASVLIAQPPWPRVFCSKQWCNTRRYRSWTGRRRKAAAPPPADTSTGRAEARLRQQFAGNPAIMGPGMRRRRNYPREEAHTLGAQRPTSRDNAALAGLDDVLRKGFKSANVNKALRVFGREGVETLFSPEARLIRIKWQWLKMDQVPYTETPVISGLSEESFGWDDINLRSCDYRPVDGARGIEQTLIRRDGRARGRCLHCAATETNGKEAGRQLETRLRLLCSLMNTPARAPAKCEPGRAQHQAQTAVRAPPLQPQLEPVSSPPSSTTTAFKKAHAQIRTKTRKFEESLRKFWQLRAFLRERREISRGKATSSNVEYPRSQAPVPAGIRLSDMDIVTAEDTIIFWLQWRRKLRVDLALFVPETRRQPAGFLRVLPYPSSTVSRQFFNPALVLQGELMTPLPGSQQPLSQGQVSSGIWANSPNSFTVHRQGNIKYEETANRIYLARCRKRRCLLRIHDVTLPAWCIADKSHATLLCNQASCVARVELGPRWCGGQTTRLSPRRTGLRFPAGSLPDSRAWESFWTMRRVFSGISRFPRSYIPALPHTHITSLSSALKTSMYFRWTSSHWAAIFFRQGRKDSRASDESPGEGEIVTEAPTFSGGAFPTAIPTELKISHLSNMTTLGKTANPLRAVPAHLLSMRLEPVLFVTEIPARRRHRNEERREMPTRRAAGRSLRAGNI
ncbi:hypothetical protein PR048_007789 [Dryococelus australis]|uniref:Uncharacterized protein n=1 Tax=Dryococelus australis TaxID=614101 RepID=A0ABQ9HV91_9NEOP|nr:hypothetical protein PR048_007789 [Dryococelus australis]